MTITAANKVPKARRCYAASSGDCEGSISSEHYISAKILEQLGTPLTVGGLSWSAKPVALSVKALVSNVLCRHHNSLLSTLDDGAIALFNGLKEFHQNN